MSPSIGFLAGLVLIWIVATGRAKAVWDAITLGQTAQDPTTVPGIEPGAPAPGGDPAPGDPSLPPLPYYPRPDPGGSLPPLPY